MGALTVDQSVEDELAVLFHKVVDVSKNATESRVQLAMVFLSIEPSIDRQLHLHLSASPRAIMTIPSVSCCISRRQESVETQ